MKRLHSIRYLMLIPLLIANIACARSSSYPFISGDTFRAIAHHIFDETNKSIAPESVKKGDIIFLKTDYVGEFFNTIHPHIAQPYILLTHNADVSPIYCISVDHKWKGHDFSAYLEDPKLIVWFAQNIDLAHPKLKALPLGIANNYWKHGDVNVFRRAQSSAIPLTEKMARMYVNYAASTNSKERTAAWNQCKSFPFCDVAKRKAFNHYLEDVKRYRFILSPPGNGLDCHRTWEALLMGSIPVMKHSLIDPLFDGLPVIFVHEWSEITEKFLEQKYQEILKSTYHLDRMYAEYWIQMIKSYQ